MAVSRDIPELEHLRLSVDRKGHYSHLQKKGFIGISRAFLPFYQNMADLSSKKFLAHKNFALTPRLYPPG
jgi:hypothetical protein